MPQRDLARVVAARPAHDKPRQQFAQSRIQIELPALPQQHRRRRGRRNLGHAGNVEDSLRLHRRRAVLIGKSAQRVGLYDVALGHHAKGASRKGLLRDGLLKHAICSRKAPSAVAARHRRLLRILPRTPNRIPAWPNLAACCCHLVLHRNLWKCRAGRRANQFLSHDLLAGYPETNSDRLSVTGAGEVCMTLRSSYRTIPVAVAAALLLAPVLRAQGTPPAQSPDPAATPAPAQSSAQPTPPPDTDDSVPQPAAPPIDTGATPASAFAAPPQPVQSKAAPAQPAPEKRTYTVPEGTKILLQLRSGINTRSAKAGDGVYLASTFPVVFGNKVLIPPGVYVQGVIDRVERAGRVKGRSQLDMHFTSIIYPNGSVVEIPGIVNSLPGARQQQVKNDGEGTNEHNPNKNRNAGEVAKIALPTGAGVGTIGGAISGHPITGGVIGVGAGLAAMGIASLFTRGADVNIDAGTQVEMVLQRPLVVEETNLGHGSGGDSMTSLTPAADQPKPLEKPRHEQILCPPGSLGCE